jgi:hypothetical protein
MGFYGKGDQAKWNPIIERAPFTLSGSSAANAPISLTRTVPTVQYIQFISVCARGNNVPNVEVGFTVKAGNDIVWRGACTLNAPTYLANLGEAGIHFPPNVPLSVNVPAGGNGVIVDVAINGIGF